MLCISLLFTGCAPGPEVKISQSSVENNPISYTTEQAQRGRKIYLDQCVLCHGTTLSNGQFGSPLKGAYFQSRWRNKTVAELYLFTFATMPPDSPMSLAKEDYADVMAFVLQANAVEPGTEELPINAEALLMMKVPW